jgi:hypothetical protein
MNYSCLFVAVLLASVAGCDNRDASTPPAAVAVVRPIGPANRTMGNRTFTRPVVPAPPKVDERALLAVCKVIANRRPDYVAPWPEVLRKADTPLALERAYYNGLHEDNPTSNPLVAFESLLRGFFNDEEAALPRDRRVQLLLRSAGPPGDRATDWAFETVNLDGYRRMFQRRLSVSWWALNRHALVCLRAERLSTGAALALARCEPQRRFVATYVLAVSRGNQDALQYWRQRLTADCRALADLKTEPDLRTEEIHDFLRTLVRQGLMSPANLTDELQRQVESLRPLFGSRMSTAALLFAAGLDGEPDAVERDLAALLQPASRKSAIARCAAAVRSQPMYR